MITSGAVRKSPTRPAPYAHARGLMTAESRCHIYDPVCLNQISPLGQVSRCRGGSSEHEPPNTVFICTLVVSWGHSGGVRMKIGEVPPSPR